jgi:hypothetical protein
MPIWLYHLPSWLIAVIMVVLFEGVGIGGLYLVRRYAYPRLHFHDGVNDAVGGTIQAIGVFYGVTVGLIAVGVWNSYTNVSSLASQEAASIGALYRDVSSYPDPIRGDLQQLLRDYTIAVIEKDWPAHRMGQVTTEGTAILSAFQARLFSFDPVTNGQQALHAEALRTFNQLVEARRLRIDAVTTSLSGIMWFVIWIGAAISLSVGYFFSLEDARLHTVLIALMAGLLAIVVFLIIANDRPFLGDTAVTPSSYQLILNTLMSGK